MPTAADLPVCSIVATGTMVFIKDWDSAKQSRPWSGIGECAPTDADIDALLQSGDATVLRVGRGS
jgi:hypothetical protein